jgi:nucleoside-diphosphate-sugar epimerase
MDLGRLAAYGRPTTRTACATARIANPYGAGQNLSRGLGVVTTLLHHALTGQQIVIWGDGETIRDFIHISDVATCLVALACAPQSDVDFVINVGTGIGTSLNEIVTALEMFLGRCIQVGGPRPALSMCQSVCSRLNARVKSSDGRRASRFPRELHA